MLYLLQNCHSEEQHMRSDCTSNTVKYKSDWKAGYNSLKILMNHVEVPPEVILFNMSRKRSIILIP